MSEDSRSARGLFAPVVFVYFELLAHRVHHYADTLESTTAVLICYILRSYSLLVINMYATSRKL